MPVRGFKPVQLLIWVGVAVLGATGWTVLALNRGEEVSAIWIVAAAVGSYLIAQRFYARFIARRVLRVDDLRATPAERLDDGVDYHPTDKRVLFGHHFAAIAGAGPLVGPVLAAQMGYLPGTIWIIVGVIFAGAVQDMVVLFFSMRRNGTSLGQMARDEIGKVGGIAAMVAVFAIMIIILAVLAMIVVNALAESAWGTFSIAMTIPIAFFMGFYLRYLRPGRITEVSLIGVVLLLAAIIGGSWIAESSFAETFVLKPTTLVICLVVYGFVASVLPVWMLLAPRDYLSTFMKVGTIVLLAAGVLLAAPNLTVDPITEFARQGTGPVFAGGLFPFAFITIACGALSGFHSLISSGTTPKMIEKESHVPLIGYGSMLMESFVAIMALVAACVIDPGLYYAMNAPAGVMGDTLQSASQAVAGLGFSITPDQLADMAKAVGEESLVSRTGGAPTLAVGMAIILAEAFGSDGMMSFWYHFAIMFEALFILTAVDAATRVGRFMLQDMIGNVSPRFRDKDWKPGIWITSAGVVLAWGYFLWVGVTDPLGGINQLFPLFGTANQLLACIALSICTTLLVKSGRLKWAWVTGAPLLFALAVTMTASWQKIFDADPALGFFAQRAKYQDALDEGKVLAPAKSLEDMSTVVHNSTVTGTLSIVFAVLTLVVVGSCAWVCVKAVRNGGSLPMSETPYVPSTLPPLVDADGNPGPDGIDGKGAERELVGAGAGAGAAGGSGAGRGSGGGSAGGAER
ncbi:carbon starvation CstA family protein (plasmid) [Streptomyces sp. BI20]|uniref:carbon starvation CstA family protein n=1 Tax=Streptomyces sp. BI20 TaxID=3403460 RepID=UPI003C707789